MPSDTCPYFVASFSYADVHAILCCDGKRMTGQLVTSDSDADINEHVQLRCSEPTWQKCPYVRELAGTSDSMGEVFVSALHACLRERQPDERGAAHD